MTKAILYLEDGTIYEGIRFGAHRDAICEMVFNTGLAGYLELLTDASYAGQGLVMASPIIGNYGIFPEQAESWRAWADAMIVRDLTGLENDARGAGSLEQYLVENNLPGIRGVDTRHLTLHLRELGTMTGILTDYDGFDPEAAMKKMKGYSNSGVVPRVSCTETSFHPAGMDAGDRPFAVAMLDFGLKRNIIRKLNEYGCDVTVYPWDVEPEAVLQTRPDGIMLSNGPGNPKDCAPILPNIRVLMDSGVTMFAICLGHQLTALATGANTYKLKYGHRGTNHPVQELETGRVMSTSQNHGYAVDADSVDPEVAVITLINLNDRSVEGMRYIGRDVFTVQFHPEGAPGPKDSEYLFRVFTGRMMKRREAHADATRRG